MVGRSTEHGQGHWVCFLVALLTTLHISYPLPAPSPQGQQDNKSARRTELHELGQGGGVVGSEQSLGHPSC